MLEGIIQEVTIISLWVVMPDIETPLEFITPSLGLSLELVILLAAETSLQVIVRV